MQNIGLNCMGKNAQDGVLHIDIIAVWENSNYNFFFLWTLSPFWFYNSDKLLADLGRKNWTYNKWKVMQSSSKSRVLWSPDGETLSAGFEEP